MERNFKGIWIPKEIWESDKLTLQEKVFLVEIDSLDNDKGCYASNKYFSDFFGISKGRCSQVISKLEEKGYITTNYVYEDDNKTISKRIMKVVNKLNTPSKYPKWGSKYPKHPYLENDKDNNTVFNNTSNNTKEYTSDFETFWNEYPKKIDKRKAFKSFKTAIKNHSLETIVQGTKQYAQFVEQEGTPNKFIKHGSTFLNNTSYLNKYEIEGGKHERTIYDDAF